MQWLYSEVNRKVGHFRRYTKKNLVELTTSSGFDIVNARYFDVAGIISWYINFTLLKNEISGRSVSLYDRFVVPAMRVIEGLVPPPDRKERPAGRKKTALCLTKRLISKTGKLAIHSPAQLAAVRTRPKELTSTNHRHLAHDKLQYSQSRLFCLETIATLDGDRNSHKQSFLLVIDPFFKRLCA